MNIGSEGKLRIVFVISGLLPGGAETQVLQMACELSARGHAVAIYTLTQHVTRAAELDSSGVELRVDNKRTVFDPFVLARLTKYLHTFQADLIHGFLYDGNFYGRLAGALSGIRVLDSERNDNYRFNLNQRLGHLLTRRLACGVVANSHAGARFASGFYRLPAEHVHVVWNGIDLDRLDKRLSTTTQPDYKSEIWGSRDVKVAVLVGSIKPQKDYLLGLRVAAELVRRDRLWRVLFVGDQVKPMADKDTGTKAAVQGLYRELGLDESRVLFIGLRKDVPELVSQCNVLFSTSIHEGFPNVVLEAMAVGTPVVSTEYSDIRLILPFPWQVATGREPAELADAILRADVERDSVIAAQRQWVEANATIKIAASRLEEIYQYYVGGLR